MDEAGWLASVNPSVLLEHLCGSEEVRQAHYGAQPKGSVSARKLRAFAVACLELLGRARPDHYRRIETGVDENPMRGGTGTDFSWACSWAADRPGNEKWLAARAGVLRDIVGNPFRPMRIYAAWQTTTVVSLATAIYQEHAFARTPILGDALEDAGCTDENVLLHCRQSGEHFLGCWVIDLLLGKE